MKMRTLFAVTLIICLSITQIAPVLAEQTEASPPPFVPYRNLNDSTYKIGRYDVLDIIILGHREKGIESEIGAGNFKEVMVGVDGYVNLPLAGSVKLSGLTIDEAVALLKEELGEYLKIPDLSIKIKRYGGRQVYVMGEVNRQGVYEIEPNTMNIFAAISRAGGITKRGRPKHIAVVRMVGDELKMQEINLDNFIKKQDASQNIALLDGDMVYVPRSNKIIIQEDIMPIATVYGLYKTITR